MVTAFNIDKLNKPATLVVLALFCVVMLSGCDQRGRRTTFGNQGLVTSPQTALQPGGGLPGAPQVSSPHGSGLDPRYFPAGGACIPCGSGYQYGGQPIGAGPGGFNSGPLSFYPGQRLPSGQTVVTDPVVDENGCPIYVYHDQGTTFHDPDCPDYTDPTTLKEYAKDHPEVLAYLEMLVARRQFRSGRYAQGARTFGGIGGHLEPEDHEFIGSRMHGTAQKISASDLLKDYEARDHMPKGHRINNWEYIGNDLDEISRSLIAIFEGIPFEITHSITHSLRDSFLGMEQSIQYMGYGAYGWGGGLMGMQSYRQSPYGSIAGPTQCCPGTAY